MSDDVTFQDVQEVWREAWLKAALDMAAESSPGDFVTLPEDVRRYVVDVADQRFAQVLATHDREVAARAWGEAIDEACAQGTIQTPDNPYRAGAAR